jgi:hypothetical protein
MKLNIPIDDHTLSPLLNVLVVFLSSPVACPPVVSSCTHLLRKTTGDI